MVCLEEKIKFKYVRLQEKGKPSFFRFLFYFIIHVIPHFLQKTLEQNKQTKTHILKDRLNSVLYSQNKIVESVSQQTSKERATPALFYHVSLFLNATKSLWHLSEHTHIPHQECVLVAEVSQSITNTHPLPLMHQKHCKPLGTQRRTE